MAIGQGTGNAHGLVGMVLVHDARDILQGFRHRANGVVHQAIAQRHQKQGFAVGGAFAVWVMHMVDQVFHIFATVLPVAHFAVVHEGPVFPDEGVAIGSGDGRARGGPHMREKQLGLNVGGQGAQVAVVPSGQDVFEQARGGALGVPGHAKAIPIGHPGRLGGRQALADDRVLLVKDQVFQVNLWTRVGNPSAHGNLLVETDKSLTPALGAVRPFDIGWGLRAISQTAVTGRQRP